jgi:hypothetical protein
METGTPRDKRSRISLEAKEGMPTMISEEEKST